MTDENMVQVFGQKSNGERTLVGTAQMPPLMKARELVTEHYGQFDENDDFSDAATVFYLMRSIIEYCKTYDPTVKPLGATNDNP